MTFNVILDSTYQLASCLFPRKCCPFLSFQQMCRWEVDGVSGGGGSGPKEQTWVVTLLTARQKGRRSLFPFISPHVNTTHPKMILLSCELHLSWLVLYSQSLAQLLGYDNSQQTCFKRVAGHTRGLPKPQCPDGGVCCDRRRRQKIVLHHFSCPLSAGSFLKRGRTGANDSMEMQLK